MSTAASGLTAQTIVSAPRTPTFAQNSVEDAATRSAATSATVTPKRTRCRDPAGTVRGSVSMKKRKTRISGENARIVHRWRPSTGPRCQRAVIACPVAATTAATPTKTIQNETASPTRASRDRIAKPPTTMIASASASAGDIGPHQKSSGSTRPGPSSRKHRTSPKFDGLKTWLPAEPDHVLGQQRDGGRRREDPPPLRAPPVAVLCARHPEDECDAVPGEERARRPDEHVLPPSDDPDLEHGTGADRDEDLRDRETEVERDLAEDLERDDDRSQVQTRVANARQDDRIRLPTDREPAPAAKRGLLASRAPAQAVRAHLIRELADADRLLEVAGESGFAHPVATGAEGATTSARR